MSGTVSVLMVSTGWLRSGVHIQWGGMGLITRGVTGTLPLPKARGLMVWFAFSSQPSRILRGAQLFGRPRPKDLFPLFRWKKDAGE